MHMTDDNTKLINFNNSISIIKFVVIHLRYAIHNFNSNLGQLIKQMHKVCPKFDEHAIK